MARHPKQPPYSYRSPLEPFPRRENAVLRKLRRQASRPVRLKWYRRVGGSGGRCGRRQFPGGVLRRYHLYWFSGLFHVRGESAGVGAVEAEDGRYDTVLRGHRRGRAEGGGERYTLLYQFQGFPICSRRCQRGRSVDGADRKHVVFLPCDWSTRRVRRCERWGRLRVARCCCCHRRAAATHRTKIRSLASAGNSKSIEPK